MKKRFILAFACALALLIVALMHGCGTGGKI